MFTGLLQNLHKLYIKTQFLFHRQQAAKQLQRPTG